METFADLISSPTPVLVDVFAEWCAPCKIMAGILKKVKETQGDSLRIIKIDIDKNMNIAQHYAISSVPTLMIFKNGKQLWRQSGVIEANELNKIVEMFKYRKKTKPTCLFTKKVSFFTVYQPLIFFL